MDKMTQLRRDIRKLERREKQQETHVRGSTQIEHKHRVKGKGVSVAEALLIAVGNEEDWTMLVRPLRHSESRIIIIGDWDGHGGVKTLFTPLPLI